MPDIVTHAAIVGRTQLIPGILPVRTTNPAGECLVAHNYPPRIVDPTRKLDLDVSDCTLFTVTHKDFRGADFQSRIVAEELLERTLQAISEVTIWNKAADIVGKVSAFLRQVGRLDVKYFFIQAPGELLVGWRNPLFEPTRDVAAMVAGFLGNMVVTNGPAASPVPPVTRRAMSALDLVNLGFYTESFVSLFALVDDLTQEVVKAGMARKGLATRDQDSFLRAIRDQRLRHFLNNVTKMCDWHSLQEVNLTLSERLDKANERRNKIMHGSAQLSRQETIESSNALLDVIDWLRTNPFGYPIPTFPLLVIAEGQFFLVPAGGSDDVGKDDASKSGEGLPAS